MAGLLDPFIPRPEFGGRHATLVRAPANLAFEVARNLDIQSIPGVHAIFWLRTKLLRAKAPSPVRGISLVALTESIGWGVLVDQPGCAYVSGAACQPWLADVVFSPIAADQFAGYAEPDRVKIVWSLEVEALKPALTRLSTETRVLPTDDQARAKFRRYWRVFGFGIRPKGYPPSGLTCGWARWGILLPISRQRKSRVLRQASNDAPTKLSLATWVQKFRFGESASTPHIVIGATCLLVPSHYKT